MSDRDRGDGGIWFGPDGDEEPEGSSFRERVERFEAWSRDEAEYSKIFSELGFTFVDDGCGGTCPICENRPICPTYPELKAEWEALATERRRSPAAEPGTDRLHPVDPPHAKKLIEGAVAHAWGLGFAPDPDYREARLVLQGIDADACTAEFSYGKGGKPLYLAGPNDSLTRQREIVDTLTRRFGPEGFRFIAGHGGHPTNIEG